MVRTCAEFLAKTEAFIARGEALCAQQTARIAKWWAWGKDTAEAEMVLAQFEQTLTEMRLYQARLLAESDEMIGIHHVPQGDRP